ncbi:MAG TPA: hypothetical protein ENN03_08790 [bacterium]|nr:hypothetical protein [bacterium]
MKPVSAVQKIGIVLLLSGPGLSPWFCAPRSSSDDLARLTTYMAGSFSSHAQYGSFYGKTRDTSCTSAHRGAVYATSEVTITSRFLITWDRGFNASGEQVWGSEGEGYHFTRIQLP